MIHVVPHVTGCTIERLFVVPSALRTLSVVTLLSAVSGTVFLLNNDHGPKPVAGETSFNSSRAGSVESAALAASLIPRPRVDAAAEHVKVQVQAKLEAEKTAAAAAKAKARAKAVAKAERRRAAAVERASRSARRDPRALARLMVAERGWGTGQFSCLDSLWKRESGWNYRATNPTSGAYGIPQALPGGKMASAGSDWRTNPATQIRWGLGYIADRYGTPCGAWSHSESSGWY